MSRRVMRDAVREKHLKAHGMHQDTDDTEVSTAEQHMMWYNQKFSIFTVSNQ